MRNKQDIALKVPITMPRKYNRYSTPVVNVVPFTNSEN